MNGPNRREYLKAGIATTVGLGVMGARPAEADDAASPAGEEVSPERLAELAAELARSTGRLILPGDDGYEKASDPANGRFNGIRPFAVAQCRGEADVVICVKWSVKYGVLPVVRGCGHSYAGFSTTQELLIDVEALNQVTIDRNTGVAVVGGAANNRGLFEHTVDGPFILPAGTCLAVGLGGLTLGGGIGYNTRWGGLTCDRLRSTRVVIASGEVVDATPDHPIHKDLFWACQGGAGGSFGINTSFTFNLARVPEVDGTYFRFEWRGSEAAKAVFMAFHQILTNPTPKLNAVAMAQAIPIGPKGPREAIDVMSRGHYLGTPDELRALLRPMLAAATPTKQTLESMKFWDIQRIWVDWENRDKPSHGTHSFGDISRYVRAPLSAKATHDLVELLAAAPARSDEANCSLWSLGWVGGAEVNRYAPTETAYVHRNMLTLLRPTTVWPNNVPEAFVAKIQKWTEDMVRLIEPDKPVESYQNFPNRSLANPLPAYYGVNLRRLREVKKRYDPKNLFRNPQSIPPA